MNLASRPEEHLARAVLLRVAAVACFALMAAAIKVAADEGASLAQIIFYRAFFSLPLLVLWIGLGPGWHALLPNRILSHVTRAGIGLLSMAMSFQALVMLPLAEATVLSFTAPIFSTALSALLLRESVGRHRWLSVSVGLLGVLIVIQPTGSNLSPTGSAIGLAAAAGVACVAILLRQISATESATSTVFWFAVATMLVTGPAQFLFNGRSDGMLWLLFAFIGLTGGGAQLLYTASFHFGPVSALSPFDYSQLVWVTILGWLIWEVQPPASTYFGAAVIIASTIYLTRRERRQAAVARLAERT